MLRFVPALANFLTRLPKFLSGFFRALLDFLRSPICFSAYLSCSGLVPVSIAVARPEYQSDRRYESQSAGAHLRSFPPYASKRSAKPRNESVLELVVCSLRPNVQAGRRGADPGGRQPFASRFARSRSARMYAIQ